MAAYYDRVYDRQLDDNGVMMIVDDCIVSDYMVMAYDRPVGRAKP